MSDLVSYEAKVLGRKKVEKEKADGTSYTLVELSYESNGKDMKTRVLGSNKKVVELLKALKKDDEVALVFEKKGKFNQLVNILPKGESKKFKSASSGGNYKKTQTFDSKGLERGNALHCASRIVAAQVYQGKLDSSDPSKLAQLVNDLADLIQRGRQQEETKAPETKKDDSDDFEEVKKDLKDDVSFDDEPSVDEDFNDDIPF